MENADLESERCSFEVWYLPGHFISETANIQEWILWPNECSEIASFEVSFSQ